MKAGTKVSYGVTTGTYAPRGYGLFVSAADGLTLVATHEPNSVHPVVAVPSDRVAAVNEKETHEEHEARLRKEAADAAVAAAKKAKHGGKTAVLIAFFVLLLGAVSAMAAPPDAINVFGLGATNNGTVQAWAIIGARSANNGTPVITSIDAATDTPSTASVHAYQVTEVTQCTFTNSTVSIPVTTTNTGTKWDSGFIVVQHRLSDTYEKRVLATSGGLTNLQVTAATIATVVPGDIIYKVVDNAALGSIGMVTNATLLTANKMFVQRYSSSPIFVGQKGKPLLMEVTATNSAAAYIYNVSGYYAP